MSGLTAGGAFSGGGRFADVWSRHHGRAWTHQSVRGHGVGGWSLAGLTLAGFATFAVAVKTCEFDL